MDVSMLILTIILSTTIPLAILYLVYRKIMQSLPDFSQLIPSELSQKRSTAAHKAIQVKRAKKQAALVTSAKSKFVSNVGNIDPMIGTLMGLAKEKLKMTDDEIFASIAHPDFQKGFTFLAQLGGTALTKVQELTHKKGSGSSNSSKVIS